MTAADYDAWYDTPRGRWIGDTEYELILKLLVPEQGSSLLDVGCGTGWFTRRFAAAPGLRVTGIDINQDWLVFARSRDPRSQYLRADALDLPFEDASFDYVVSVTALGFVTDWPRALAEMFRVARKRLLVGLLNRSSLLRLQSGRDGGGYRGAHWHTRREILRALESLHVRDMRVRSAIFLPGGSGTARLLERVIPQRLPFGGFIAGAGDRRIQESDKDRAAGP